MSFLKMSIEKDRLTILALLWIYIFDVSVEEGIKLYN